MRFPTCSTAFFHYLDQVGLETTPFPNPLTSAHRTARWSTWPASRSMPRSSRTCRRSSTRWRRPGPRRWSMARSSAPCRPRSARATCGASRRSGTALIPIWDDRTFYGFIATSDAFMRRSFRHLEIFGQVGFGTGGWDTDFPNSMLEILRVVYTNCDEDQRLVTGGVEQMPRRLWKMQPDKMAHWPRGTSLETLHAGAPRPGVVRIAPAARRPLRHHRPLGRDPGVPRRARHLPVLAADHPHRGRRADVLAEALDGARPHPLHAVGQDLRDGRPAVLEGQGPEDRPRRHEHDAERPPDPRHLSVRQRAGQAGGHLPLLFLDGRRAEAAAAAGREAGRS